MTVVVTGRCPDVAFAGFCDHQFFRAMWKSFVRHCCESRLSQQAGKSEEKYNRTFAYHLVLSRLVIFRQDGGIGVGFMAAVGKSYLVFDELHKHPLTREGGCPSSAQISDNASAGIARYRL